MSAYAKMLKDELDHRLSEQATPRKRSLEFDVMASELALSHLDMTTEEIEAGVIDGGGDGGIDSAYVFVETELLTEDHGYFDPTFKPGAAHQNISISLWLLQAKEETSFGTNPIVSVKDTISVVLDMTRDRDKTMTEVYSTDLLDKIFLFRRILSVFRREHPQITVHFKYATLGETLKPNRAVSRKSAELENAVKTVLPQASAYSELVGAEAMWQSLSRAPSYKADLRVENSFAYEVEGDRSYIGTVRLADYLKFLTEDDDLTYRDYLFDGNVRHHEGDRADVNQEIRGALLDDDAPEFWWLNNGVTIICSQASSQGKTFTLSGVQIVNGLQTSRTIFSALRGMPTGDPKLSRSVLVRIIEIADDPGTVNKVIRATNRQTPVREESLRATDPVQLHIEKTLARSDLYYDRRRNYYKNVGKPRSKIISVKYLTQALLAVALSRPDDARARPGDIMKEAEYGKVFDLHTSSDIYAWVLLAQRHVDSKLLARQDVSLAERNDARFLVAARVVKNKNGSRPSSADEVLALGAWDSVFTDASIEEAFAAFRKLVHEKIESDENATRDRLSKTRSFASEYLKIANPEVAQSEAGGAS